jgi:A/G-specific adenine glycosylase
MTKRNPTGAVRKAVLAWFARARRDLPWRRTRDPYAIWVSETMLQQTRVATVQSYYRRWMRRFPTVRALARAKLDDVLSHWQGMGYYARARNFHAAAKIVATRHGGVVPRGHAERLALPGVGPYTAGAIGSIAYDLPEPLLDGNVERVLCRLHAIRGDPRRTRTRARLWEIAGELVRGERPGDLNQGLMELGATVCTPAPRCEACPVARACAARRLGRADAIPAIRRKKKVPLVHDVAFRIVRGAKWLLVRRAHGGLLGGLWELPGEAIGVRAGRRIGTVEHAFTHKKLRLAVYEGALGTKPGIGFAGRRWVTEKEMARLPMSRLQRKVVEVCCER